MVAAILQLVKSGGTKMKKFIIILVLLVFLTSCGKAEDKPADSTTIKTDEGHEITVLQDEEGSLPLPEDFPEDIIPVYKDPNIIVSSNDADGSSQIIAMSEEPMEDIVNFYKEVLSDGENTNETLTPETYMLMGIKDGINYMVSVAEADDEDLESDKYKSMFTVIVFPEDEEFGEGEIEEEPEEEESGTTETVDEGTSMPSSLSWPEDYPEDYLEAYQDGEPQLFMVTNAGQSGMGMIMLVTKDDSNKVIEYYKSKLKNSENYTSMLMPEGGTFTGIIEGMLFQISIFENEDIETYPGYKTAVSINYQPME
jgi:hypothetical protein